MSQVAGTCYSSKAAALSAIASGEVGKVVSAGSVLYVVDAVPASGSSITYTFTPVVFTPPAPPGIARTVAVEIPDCSLLDWSDGIGLGWAVAGVWLAVAIVLHLREAAHS